MFKRSTSDPGSPSRTHSDPLCLPFFHPTRVAFVDDERSFLDYFVRGLSLDVPVSLYESGRDLIDDIAAGRLATRLDLECWSNWSGRAADERHNHLLALDKTMFLMRVFARSRFDVLSVAVIDYAMPGMNGLQLCERLHTLPCRKILLTGQANEQTAVDAFNDGLIDYFVPKSAPDADGAIRAQIRRFQRDFVAEATILVRQALRTESTQTWDDPGFCDLLEGLCTTHGAVEYYAITDPAEGFVLVDGTGRGRLLLTFSANSIAAQQATARVSGAPPEVLDGLARESVGTYFCDTEGREVLDADAWRRACVVIEPFPNRSDRFYALLDHCRPFDVSPANVLGLDAFLAGRR